MQHPHSKETDPTARLWLDMARVLGVPEREGDPPPPTVSADDRVWVGGPDGLVAMTPRGLASFRHSSRRP